MRSNSIQGQVVKEYLEKYPKATSLMLARMIYKENKELWKGVEAVRASIRYYRGASGNRKRQEAKDKKYFKSSPYTPQNS